MRLAHVLVLMLSCSCSLETRPLSAGAARSVRASENQTNRAAVSFEVWRRVDWVADAAADGGDALRTHVSSDAAMSEPSAANLEQRPPARGSADNLRAPSMLHTPASAGAGAQSGAAGDVGAEGAADAAVSPAADDGMDAGPVPADMRDASAGAAGSLPMIPPMPAGAGSDASGIAGQGGAAGGTGPGMDAAVAADATVALVDAGVTPDTPDQQATRGELLKLVEQTLDNAVGAGRTPDVRSLATTVRTLLALPESERTRSLVADVLVRLASSNVCRFDNLEDCAELCSALAQDCSVCRWDTSCQLSVQLMCAVQRGFSCDVWR